MSESTEKAGGLALPSELQDQLKAAQQELMLNEESFGGSSIKFISTAGNKLSLDSVDLPGNALACLIIDSVGVNALYTEKYKRDAKTSPKCFAFSRNKQDFAPKKEDVTEMQAEDCESCKMQEWGSASLLPYRLGEDTKAKACSSKRRLALVCCGEIDKKGNLSLFDGDELQESIRGEILFLDVSVTSVKNYKNYTIKMGTKYKGELPLFCIPTKISLIPDDKYQRSMLFEEIKTSTVEGKEIETAPIRNVPVVKELLERNQEAKELIVTPFPKSAIEEDDADDEKYSVRIPSVKKVNFE